MAYSTSAGCGPSASFRFALDKLTAPRKLSPLAEENMRTRDIPEVAMRKR